MSIDIVRTPTVCVCASEMDRMIHFGKGYATYGTHGKTLSPALWLRFQDLVQAATVGRLLYYDFCQ